MKTIRNTKIRCFFCIALLFISFSSTGQIVWESTNGPYGESVIAMTERSDGTMIIGTRDNGIYKSTNNGHSWSSIHQGFACIIPRTYAMLVDTNDVIYAGILSMGLYRCYPGADYWHKVNDSTVLNQITSIAKTSNGVLFLYGYNGSKYALYRSSNMGITIDTVQLPVPNCIKIYVDQNNILFLISSVDVYRSYDEGNTWEIITNSNIQNISDFKAVTSQFYLCSSGIYGIYVSLDAGISWTQANNGLTNLYVSSIEYDPNGNIYAGTRKKGVFKATTPYNSWQPTSNGLYHSNISELQFSVTNKLLAVPYSGGVYYLDYISNEWYQYPIIHTRINSITTNPQNETMFAVPYEQGIYRKKTTDSLWLPINGSFTPDQIKCVAANNSGTVYKGTTAGVYKSTNDGDLWTFTGLYYYLVNYLSITDSGTLYAVCEDWLSSHFLFKSTDNGNTWTLIKNLGFMNFVSMAVNNQGVVIVMQNNSQYIVSTNEGASWTNYNMSSYFSPLVYSVNNGNFIVIAEDKLFLSSNSGVSWSLLYEYNNCTSNLTTVMSDEYNGLYIGTSAEYIYYTPNLFNTLQNLSNNLNPNITCFFHRTGGVIYVGTNNGVYASNIATRLYNADQISIVSSAYPNPFAEFSNITFYADEQEFVKITAFDITGKEVEVIADEIFHAGEHTIKWQPNNLGSGIYFLRKETINSVSVIKLVYQNSF